jgi:adenosylhomocysteine nucleosidase
MIALLCATPFELKIVLPLLANKTDGAAPGGMSLVRGTVGGKEILALATGVGKVAAGAGTRYLLDHHPCEAMLIYGIAGALSPDARLGDLVIADELIPGDVGVAHSGGFSITGPGLCEEDRVIFHPSFQVQSNMLERVRTAAESAGLPYHIGKVLTCDQVVLDPELRAHLGSTFKALAVEMEGAAAAQIAACEDVPFAAVRAISDELSHDFVGLEKLLEYKGQTRSNIWNKRFRLAVTDTGMLAKARGMAKGRNLALESLASCLSSFLDETWNATS